MILSFKPQFKDKILQGSKIHTIRADPHNRWHEGRKIHFATGVRTKNYNCFKMGVCRGVQSLFIRYSKSINFVEIWIDDLLKTSTNIAHAYAYDYLKTLARNDGFESVDDFFKWFNADFQGKIIHWTDFKY